MANAIAGSITPIKRFFRLLQIDRKEISYIYVYAIFAGLITLALPLGIQAIINLIAGGSVSSSLFILIAVVTVATALTGFLTIMQLTVSETIQRRIFARSAFEFAFRIPHIQLEKLYQEYPPELVNRFFDTLTIQKGLPKILMDSSTAVLQILFGLILISFYHPFFVFFGMIMILFMYIVFRFTGAQGLRTSLRESEYKYAVAHWLEELARATGTFKLCGGNEMSLNKTDDLVLGYLGARKKHFRILLTQFSGVVVFKTIIVGSLLLLGSLLVIDNQLNIGQFVAAEIIVLQIVGSVEKLILTMETIYDVLTGLEKIGTVVDLPLDRNGGISISTVNQEQGLEIELQEVCFKFENDEKPTLNNISLKINSGESLCITGYNRAGKNTLLHLLTGYYTDFNGSISYGGIPARNLDLNSLHKTVGEYTAQTDIFRGSILDNIRLGHAEMAFNNVIEAARQVRLHEYVERLPEGYMTELLPGGRNIPGSIRTKIKLARAIMFRPRLFALEDSLNNLETEERKAILNFLTRKDRPWTLIAISDDPTFAEKCDRTIIMRKGEIIEVGTFDQIKKSPHYSQIFREVYQPKS